MKVLFLLCVFLCCQQQSHGIIHRTCIDGNKQCGFAFGGGEYGNPMFSYFTNESMTSLQNLADTGANSVRVLVTHFQHNITATEIAPLTTMHSPLRSTTGAELSSLVSQAKKLGLKVFFTPLVDINWDVPTNKRAPGMKGHASRAMIGQGFSTMKWAMWFKSYSAYIMDYATFAEQHKIEQMSIGFGLETAFSHAGAHHWTGLIKGVRALYSGKISIDTANVDKFPALWKNTAPVDVLGVIAWDWAGSPSNDTVEELMESWLPFVKICENVKTMSKLPIMISEIGYQSRPNCFTSPGGVIRLDGKDCSGWLECYDMKCQANAYEAFMRVVTSEKVFDGVHWWLWRNDPTAGGTCCDQYTPFGKPAEAHARVWFGGYPKNTAGTLANSINDLNQKTIKEAQSETTTKATPLGKGKTNGYVFGGPDEWSSPYYRYDSAGARQSLKMLQSVGGNAAEFPVMWYYNNNNDTEIYPIETFTSSLRTSSVSELKSIISYAKELNMTTCLTPMLDPDYDLPGNCRQCKNPPGPGWRGTIGMHWGKDCSPGSQWYRWHENYAKWMIYYAKLAEEWKVDEFLISHELDVPTRHCNNLWSELLKNVRKVYSGRVSVAFVTQLIQHYKTVDWIADLDYIGVDCYYHLAHTNHPELPWENLPVSELLKAWQPIIGNLSSIAHFWKKPIKCTETGYQSRPWNYAGNWAGPYHTHQLDPWDCSVWDQCYSGKGQSLGYDAMLTSLYAQEWYEGFYLWMWRADPTAGGPTDDTFTSNGKPDSLKVLNKFWGQ
eukprot:TRINITY_DN3422_c0_g1_i1.p1 TRINITY_DN3422_c0_g1~~TRINITY_DN3422_c0_g1_i1.p1  ORF type:complete len:787 (-),score=27.39 TRINITY_DN3422_c0_g1_i1:1184-3514(-)